MSDANLFEIAGLTFSYRRRQILRDITLQLRQGEIVALLGPNGSGKTTFLKLLLGLYQPQGGTIRFEGRPLPSYQGADLAKRLAYVPQTHREAFAYTVEDVVLMGRMPHHSLFSVYSAEDRRLAEQAMARVGVAHLRERAYTEISGGERQLTLIARSLAQEAGVFIMDEPVNGLDYGNQMRLLHDIKRLAENGLTFIMTTHFPDHALLLADRVILFQDGAVIADGAPAATITAESLQRLYRLEVSVLAIGVTGATRVCVPGWAF